MNSKQKGNRFERKIAELLREYGYNARRGFQFRSGQEEADVVGLPGIHIECKHVENLNLEKALQQSERDAAKDEIPIVIHKKNRKPIFVTYRVNGEKITMPFDDFMKMYKRGFNA